MGRFKPVPASESVDVDQVLAEHKANLARSNRETDPYRGQYGWYDSRPRLDDNEPAPVRYVPPVGGAPHNPVISGRQRRAAAEAAKKSRSRGGKQAKNRGKP